jgi:phosphohistidine phosphatase
VQLLVVRHAIAEDRETFATTGRDDALRPLTAVGARKMKKTARGLRQLVPAIDALITSPLTRASETAEIVRREYELAEPETSRALEPNAALVNLLVALERYEQGVVAVVGHEPHLGRLVTYLVSGIERSGVDLKKGGACLVEFDGPPKAGTGCLRWSVPPGLLRDLAG